MKEDSNRTTNERLSIFALTCVEHQRAEPGKILGSSLFFPGVFFVEFSLSGQTFWGWNQFEKFGGRHGKAVPDTHNALERDAPLSTLDPSNVVCLIAAKLRQPLLGEVTAQPQLSQLSAEQNQCVGHAV